MKGNQTMNKNKAILRDLIINDPQAKIRIAIKKAQGKVNSFKYSGRKNPGLVLWRI